MVMLLDGSADVGGREYCKNISLQSCNQQLDEVHKNREQRYHGTNGNGFEDKNHAQQTEQYNVASGDVGKKPDHQ